VESTGETRIQLCGRFVVRLEGRRVDDALPGALGQLLFAFLILNRLRRVDREELLLAVYGDEATRDHRARLSVLLSKVRRITGPELLVGRAQLELALPQNAFVDLEVALDAVHRAESHVAKGEWAAAWGPASLGLGGPELPQAANCGRLLIEQAPFRESGYRILMEALERSGNVAEGLLVYDRLRVTLRDELGVPPGSAVQDVYRRLLGEGGAATP